MINTKQSPHDESTSIVADRLFPSNKEYQNRYESVINDTITKYTNSKIDYSSDIFANMLGQMEILTKAVYSTKEYMEDIIQILNKIQENQRVMTQKIDDATTEEIPDETYNMTSDKIRDLMIEKVELDKPFYPSDIATEHGLDYDRVLETIEMLRKEGRIIDRD